MRKLLLAAAAAVCLAAPAAAVVNTITISVDYGGNFGLPVCGPLVPRCYYAPSVIYGNETFSFDVRGGQIINTPFTSPVYSLTSDYFGFFNYLATNPGGNAVRLDVSFGPIDLSQLQPGVIATGGTGTRTFVAAVDRNYPFIATGTVVGFYVFGSETIQTEAVIRTGGISFAQFAENVPEPSSWAMMLMGFGMVGAGLRRRRICTLASAV